VVQQFLTRFTASVMAAMNAEQRLWVSPHGTEWEADTYEEALELERDALVAEVITLREALRQIEREARDHGAPTIHLKGDGKPTSASQHDRWTLGTNRIRRVRIRKLAREALAVSSGGWEE
jgi:hypothetical protein